MYEKILPSIYQRFQEQTNSLLDQRMTRAMCQNDLWLRFIKISVFCWSIFKFLILSVLIFNMKTFSEHKLIKKLKMSKFFFWRKVPSAYHKMVSHCMIIEYIILIPVIMNFLQIFPNNKKVSVLCAFFLLLLLLLLLLTTQYKYFEKYGWRKHKSRI